MSFLANSLQMPKDDATTWVVAAVGIIATLWLVMRPKLKRRKDPLETRPMFSLSQQRQIERDMNGLMVEMLETARQMAAQLETRAAKLTVLMAEADRRIEALRQATGGTIPPADSSGTSPASSGTQPTDSPQAASSQQTSSSAPALDSQAPVEIPPDPRHAEIYAMADQGRTPTEIARSLGRPNGEVELILALRRH